MKLDHEHTPAAIAERIGNDPDVSYVRDWVYGGIDGAVTTFAIVSGVAGASLGTHVVVILGVANLIADGFSMAAGNYSGTRAENEEYAKVRDSELRHIEQEPEGEREEVRQIYRLKGFEGELLEEIVRVITSDRESWADTMMTEEHGLPSQRRSPSIAAATTFVSFLVCGVVPLASYLLDFPRPFHWASGLTAAVFFSIGSFNSRWSLSSWWLSGLRILAIGSCAAGLAYLVGWLFRGFG